MSDISFRAASFADYLARDPLREFFAVWDDLTATHVRELRSTITEAAREEDVQRYLRKNPLMLVQHLGGGHGRWVVPKPRLGSAFVPDFLIGDRDSVGRRWIAVELESPKRAMFTRGGDPSQYLSHAIRQVLNWRAWLAVNLSSAVAPRDKQGLGLEDIDPQLPGLILIGRRGLGPPDPGGLRRQLAHDHMVDIHSYDWLVERAEQRLDALVRAGQRSVESREDAEDCGETTGKR